MELLLPSFQFPCTYFPPSSDFTLQTKIFSNPFICTLFAHHRHKGTRSGSHQSRLSWQLKKLKNKRNAYDMIKSCTVSLVKCQKLVAWFAAHKKKKRRISIRLQTVETVLIMTQSQSHSSWTETGNWLKTFISWKLSLEFHLMKPLRLWFTAKHFSPHYSHQMNIFGNLLVTPYDLFSDFSRGLFKKMPLTGQVIESELNTFVLRIHPPSSAPFFIFFFKKLAKQSSKSLKSIRQCKQYVLWIPLEHHSLIFGCFRLFVIPFPFKHGVSL